MNLCIKSSYPGFCGDRCFLSQPCHCDSISIFVSRLTPASKILALRSSGLNLSPCLPNTQPHRFLPPSNAPRLSCPVSSGIVRLEQTSRTYLDHGSPAFLDVRPIGITCGSTHSFGTKARVLCAASRGWRTRERASGQDWAGKH